MIVIDTFARVMPGANENSGEDVGKALGFDLATVDAIAKGQKWFDGTGLRPERFAELGIPVDDLAVRQALNYGTDKATICRTLFFDQYTPAFSPMDSRISAGWTFRMSRVSRIVSGWLARYTSAAAGMNSLAHATRKPAIR